MKRLIACLLTSFAASSAAASADQDAGFIVLQDGGSLRATVAPAHGGELSGLELEIDGRWHELIYRARDYSETSGWRGKAPLLWPAVGMTLDPDSGVRGHYVGDRFFPMPAHGFVRDRAWRLVEQGEDSGGSFARLAISSDEETRAYYPFEFELAVNYRLDEGSLQIRYEVLAGLQNPSPMPFSIGNHVTFKAPLLGRGEARSVRFRTGMPEQLIRAENRTFSGQVVPSPFLGEQPLSALPMRKAVSLGGGAGPAELLVIDPSGLVLRLRHQASRQPEKPFIQFNLWADTEEGFFSPEPWLGTQNSLNTGAGLVRLEPGESWDWSITITPDPSAMPGFRIEEQDP